MTVLGLIAVYLERLPQNNAYVMGAASPERNSPQQGSDLLFSALLLGYGLIWIWLAIAPVNRRDWFLENLLAVTCVSILILTRSRFRFSLLSYCLIMLFMALHAVGAHYTYAEVPFGFWLKDWFALSRNPFDRIVHFSFGALLIHPVREWLMRLAGVRRVWSYYLPVSAILAQSGLFEVIEAIVAVLVSPELGNAYLGTQGDEWDAQKDMASALAGALLSSSLTIALSRDARGIYPSS
jgi:putative membrane protein